MDFSKVKHGSVTAELVGTFTLTLAILASTWGILPLIPTAVIAGLTLAIFVMSVGHASGANLNPAVTLGLFSIRKLDAANTVSYLIAQFSGALSAIVIMSLFLEGELVTRLAVSSDYKTFFAEFLGTLIFTFGIAAALQQKLKGADSGLLIGGSLTLGIILASLGSAGVINPAVATSLGVFNWTYALGPVLGAIVGMNVYVLALGKKGKI